MATGAALVVYILAGVDLRVGVGVALGVIGSALWWLDRSAAPAARSHLRRLAGTGAVSGLVATIAYDLSRTGLALFDPSPYDPFEAISMFGTLLAGEQASTGLVMGVGLAYHLVNGVAFGAAFALLSRKGGVLRGIVWGLGLEAFQVALYPGWLDIRAYQEFTRISAAGHLVYGATLGALVARHLKSEEASDGR
jgi:hypothetical protein